MQQRLNLACAPFTQKKLQDQLEQAKTENDTLLRESDSLAKQLNDKVQEALKETETLRSQLNATKVRIKKVNVLRFFAVYTTWFLI